jgi:hypothetical protein
MPTPNNAKINNSQSDWRLNIDSTAMNASITTGINRSRWIYSDSKNNKLPRKKPDASNKGVSKQWHVYNPEQAAPAISFILKT